MGLTPDGVGPDPPARCPVLVVVEGEVVVRGEHPTRQVGPATRVEG